jgi:hypothetical protein
MSKIVLFTLLTLGITFGWFSHNESQEVMLADMMSKINPNQIFQDHQKAKGPPNSSMLGGTVVHDAGLLNLTIDDDGGQTGWRLTHLWPDTVGIDQLYWSWLAVGYDGAVIDGWDLDWVNAIPITLTEPGSLADEESYGQFKDTSGNFIVDQEAFTWALNPDNDFLLLKYTIGYRGGVLINNLFVGHRSDFDINGEHGMDPSDIAAYDTITHVAYMFDLYTPGVYAGIKVLEGNLNGFHIGWGGIDPEKWLALSQSTIDPETPFPNDHAFWLSNGPFSMLPVDSCRMGFAFLSGEDLSDLQQNASSAQTKWNQTMAPFLRYASPTGDTSVIQGDSVIFWIQAYDGFGDSLTYSWYVNGLLIPGETNSSFIRMFDSLGVDTVAANVSDLWGNVSPYQWIVTVTNVGIEEKSVSPIPSSELRLFQNHPNPFYNLTTISYQLKAPFHTTLKVYDLSGRLVETLVNEKQEPGVYHLPIYGNQLPGSGVYFYQLQIGEFTSTKKLILLR